MRCLLRLLRLFIGILLLYFLVDIWMPGDIAGLSRRIKWFCKCRVFCSFNYMNNTMGSKTLWSCVANSRYFHAPSIWRDIHVMIITRLNDHLIHSHCKFLKVQLVWEFFKAGDPVVMGSTIFQVVWKVCEVHSGG